MESEPSSFKIIKLCLFNLISAFGIVCALFFFSFLLKLVYSETPISPSFISPLVLHSMFLISFCFLYPKVITSIFTNKIRLIRTFLFLLPGLLVFFVVLLLVTISSDFNLLSLLKISGFSYLVVLVVPLVEELVFRIGVTGLFRGFWKNSVATSYSCLFFAFLHWDGFSFANFSLASFPIGPLLLALFSEALYQGSKNIYASIFFHLSCNYTSVILLNSGGFPNEFIKLFYN